MRLLIVEDEPPIAEYIEDTCKSILGNKIRAIHSAHSLKDAQQFISDYPVDLCLLDLNLNGENGFDILKHSVAESFHTIVISAYTGQAVHAFEYGVLDFIPKPFDEKRLELAFKRYQNRKFRKELATRFLSVKDGNKIRIIHIEKIIYFKAADNYVEACLRNGHKELLDKPLYRLLQILPPNFIQIHRSYVIDLNEISAFGHTGCGIYQVELNNSDVLPLSRQKYKELKNMFESLRYSR